MKNYVIYDWMQKLHEQGGFGGDIPAAGGQPDPFGMTPQSDPMGAGAIPDPNIANPPQGMPPEQMGQMGAEQPADVSQDPEAPMMPEEEPQKDDFEVWKKTYFKASIKGDPNELLEMLSPIREQETLEPYQRKFVDDNWNIQLLRQNSNIEKASKEIRKGIKEQLDQNNPATTVIDHITSVLETMTMLNTKFIQILGYGSYKGELHRKYIASLTGSVQVSSSPDQENVVFNENEYSIKMATRLNADWGNLVLGTWSLREDDPERYLSEPELKRLNEGSPEEKEALRHRLVIESIAKEFETRAFIINVVGDDGTIYSVGWDLANCLRAAFSEGKVVVRSRKSDNSEAMIDDNGAILPYVDLNIYFVKETGEQDEEGQPATEEIEFIQRRDGSLFLTAGMQTVQEASNAMQGMRFKETPYQGNPSDLKTLKRCVYSAHDLIMRTC
jgi:hypothetical protein